MDWNCFLLAKSVFLTLDTFACVSLLLSPSDASRLLKLMPCKARLTDSLLLLLLLLLLMSSLMLLVLLLLLLLLMTLPLLFRRNLWTRRC